MNWPAAKLRLDEIARECLSRGSVGVSAFVETVWPLWWRYEQNDRTESLYNSIMAL